MPSKSCAVLLNIGPSNLLFDEIIVTFMDENGRQLEIECKVNLTLLINKQK